ncbi:MAG: hypothetical protein KDA24_08005 [Deltaproteobacteria bacterium]|nr:hypothetical protein [Deltaproteobacteria bacterium]
MADGQLNSGRGRVLASGILYALPTLALLGLGGAPAPILASLLAVAAAGAALSLSPSSPRRLVVGPAVLGLVLTLLWMGASLVPLPSGVLGVVAPSTAAFAQGSWEAAGMPWTGGPWSLSPGDTAVSVARVGLVLVALLFLRLHQRGGDLAPPRRALLVAGCVLLVVVGLHALLGQGAIYGVFPRGSHSFSPLTSPLPNSNDLAVLACALVPVAVAESLRRTGGGRAMAAALALVLASVAVMSLARSATLGLGVGLGLVALGVLASGSKLRAAVISGVSVLAFASIIVGVGRLTSRVGLLVDSESLSRWDGRLEIWAVAREVAQAQWITGVGARSFGAAWWSTRSRVADVHARDAEGLLPEMFATLGAPLTIVLVALGLWVLGHVLLGALAAAREGELERLGAAAGLGALLSIAMITMTTTQPAIALAAVYLFVGAGGGPGRTVGRRAIYAWGAVALALVGVSALSWAETRSMRGTDAWFGARLKADALAQGDDPMLMALRHPSDPYGFAWSGILLRRTSPQQALTLVNRSMVLDPHGAEPHRAAANVLLAVGWTQQAVGEIRLALAGATTEELPRFVDDALRLYPARADRMGLLPMEPSAAVRVVRQFAKVDAELALEAWLVLARRQTPPFEAVRAIAGSLPPSRHHEALVITSRAAEGRPEDPRFLILHGEAQLAAGQRHEGIALLHRYLRGPGADDIWRSRALYLLAEDALASEPGALAALLEHETFGGVSEEAVRAWIRGELLFAEGQLSRAAREMSTAVRLRPDLTTFRVRLAAIREEAR